MQTPETTPKTARILSIDAWRDRSGGWEWNNWYHAGDCSIETANLPPRKLLRWLRTEGYLSPRSTGRVAIDDDGYNVVVTERGNGRPLFVIEYGDIL